MNTLVGDKVDLKSLVGKHTLDWAAVSTTIETKGLFGTDPANAIAWGMDGRTYLAVEDPDDGYRSYLDEVLVFEGKNDFLDGASPVGREVVVLHTGRGQYSGKADVIEIYDTEDGHLWAVIGTENTDDYYPYCVLQWNPKPHG